MATTVELPISFTVVGISASAQARNKKRKDDWKNRVASASHSELPPDSSPVPDEVSATIVYFFEGETDIDVDNFTKPILDALIGVVYLDDGQVSQIVVRKTGLSAGLSIDDPEPVLAQALERGGDFVYIRIDEAPKHESIP